MLRTPPITEAKDGALHTLQEDLIAEESSTPALILTLNQRLTALTEALTKMNGTALDRSVEEALPGIKRDVLLARERSNPIFAQTALDKINAILKYLQKAARLQNGNGRLAAARDGADRIQGLHAQDAEAVVRFLTLPKVQEALTTLRLFASEEFKFDPKVYGRLLRALNILHRKLGTVFPRGISGNHRGPAYLGIEGKITLAIERVKATKRMFHGAFSNDASSLKLAGAFGDVDFALGEVDATLNHYASLASAARDGSARSLQTDWQRVMQTILQNLRQHGLVSPRLAKEMDLSTPLRSADTKVNWEDATAAQLSGKIHGVLVNPRIRQREGFEYEIAPDLWIPVEDLETANEFELSPFIKSDATRLKHRFMRLALHHTANGVLPVIVERMGETFINSRKKVMEERASHSLLFVFDRDTVLPSGYGTTYRETSPDRTGRTRSGIHPTFFEIDFSVEKPIPIESAKFILVPERHFPFVEKILGKIGPAFVKVGDRHAKIEAIDIGAVLLRVPDYEGALGDIMQKHPNTPLWVHGLRLPTQGDIRTAQDGGAKAVSVGNIEGIQLDETRPQKSARDGSMMFIQPKQHGELEPLYETLLGVGEIAAYAHKGLPHLVSVPVAYLPDSLKFPLMQVKVRTLSGERINAYDYLTRHAEEVVFTPFILAVQEDGSVLQPASFHLDLPSPLQPSSLKTDPYRPGKRVIYINPVTLLNERKEILSRASELNERVGMQASDEVNVMQHIIRETAHRELMELVAQGRLDPKYYDLPNFFWAEKIGLTIGYYSLDNFFKVLMKIDPDRDKAERFVGKVQKDLREQIVALNGRLGLRANDFTLPPVAQGGSSRFATAADGAGKAGVLEPQRNGVVVLPLAATALKGITKTFREAGINGELEDLLDSANIKNLLRTAEKLDEDQNPALVKMSGILYFDTLNHRKARHKFPNRLYGAETHPLFQSVGTFSKWLEPGEAKLVFSRELMAHDATLTDKELDILVNTLGDHFSFFTVDTLPSSLSAGRIIAFLTPKDRREIGIPDSAPPILFNQKIQGHPNVTVITVMTPNASAVTMIEKALTLAFRGQRLDDLNDDLRLYLAYLTQLPATDPLVAKIHAADAATTFVGLVEDWLHQGM